MKTTKRLCCMVLAVLVSIAALTAGRPAQALTWSDVAALQDDAAALEKQKKELQAQLAAVADNKAEILHQRKLLDQQVAVLASQITNTETQIAAFEALIRQTEQELIEAEAQEAAQYELFCKRVRAMEERGTVSYWSVLFNANSFTDLLARLDAVNEVMAADQAVIDQLQALQAEIAEKKEQQEQSKEEAQAAKASLVSQKADLDAKRAKANALMKELDENAAEYKAAQQAIEEEEERIQKEIVRMSRELAAQNGQGASSGGYIWPVNSRYITSTVGGRASPGGIGSTNHKGTDIGRVGYTSEIYAAKAGTVIVSQYSSSYGNYVVVSHGSGNTTLYAHMSARKVEAGQTVAQGQVLGITGSTGHSTGPHLHFEVTENGQRVNPLSHGADPKMGYLSGYTLSGSA